jgi:hypothetical protein
MTEFDGVAFTPGRIANMVSEPTAFPPRYDHDSVGIGVARP